MVLAEPGAQSTRLVASDALHPDVLNHVGRYTRLFFEPIEYLMAIALRQQDLDAFANAVRGGYVDTVEFFLRGWWHASIVSNPLDFQGCILYHFRKGQIVTVSTSLFLA